jgi:hypothetical protein
VMNSANITVRGIIIDHNPTPYIQAEIVAIPSHGAKRSRYTTPATPTTTAPGAGYVLRLGVRSMGFDGLDGRYGQLTQPKLWSGVGYDRWATGRIPMPPPDSVQVKPG